MVDRFTRGRWPLLLTAGMALIVVVLAVVQYQWSVQVSKAEGERMRKGLETSVRQFREDFNRELRRLGSSFQPGPGRPSGEDWSVFADRLDEWRQRSTYPDLVRAVFFVQPADDAGLALLRLDPDSRAIEPAEWPQQLEEPRQALRQSASAPPGRPGISPFGWTIFYEAPALVVTLTDFGERGDPRERWRGREFEGYVILELDREFLRNTFLPELVERHFGGPDGIVYQVSVSGSETPLYESAPEAPVDAAKPADMREPLLWRQQELASEIAGPAGRGGRGRAERPPDDRLPRGRKAEMGPPGRRPDRPPPGGEPFRRLRAFRDVIVSPPDAPGEWMLVVRHSQGSLEEVVAAHQNRNLAVSFGVLFLLCVSMGTILVSTRRAQRLAESQMDFVAGVSHELRTPLAVICSAADNLADGVVASKDQVAQYGTLIRDEGRRLTGMIEQTLQFAAGQSNRQTYDLKPQPVADIIEAALRQSAPAIQAAHCQVERNVPANLPDIIADRAALSQSIQNLIGNAVKYGGDSHWLGVRAETGAAPAGGSEVRILVEDKGFGISPAELPHVFDPFFRGKEAASRQIHGTGLGLSLARDAVTAMGGRLSVKSRTGEGSTFTIHLRAAAGNGAGNGAAV